jgi:hypothetical protein
VGIRLRQALALMCALYISGAHWVVLQSAAWTGMIVARAPKVGVESAVRSTFDGGHPCNLCIAVKQGQENEQKQSSSGIVLSELAKVEIVLPVEVRLVKPEAMDFRFPRYLSHGVSRSLAPPKQPPRLA